MLIGYREARKKQQWPPGTEDGHTVHDVLWELDIFFGRCHKIIRPGILVFLFIKTTLKAWEMNA